MNNSQAFDKFIVFRIADYFLALPISAAIKAINYPTSNNKDLTAAGLVQIGRHAIALINLHQKLPSSYTPQTE